MKTLPQIESWETGCAVAAHAEEMRLERIKIVVSQCKDKDIRDTFTKILKDELFHAKAFREFTTDEAYLNTLIL